jgi:hypothetical protein
MASELPVVARTRHHWITLLRKPHPILTVALLVLLAAAVFDPNPMAWLFLLVLGATCYLRWQGWRAEWMILTQRRIIRVRGIPETTSSESSLRLDRISGAVLEQTVMGKILNYGSIELEAPGQHPDVRKLDRIAAPHEFYSHVRRVVFGERSGGDEFSDPEDYITAPLPPMRPRPPRDDRPRLR